jgi:hypothetical protein
VGTDVPIEYAAFVFKIYPEHGNRMFLQNLFIHLQNYTMSQLRRPQSELSIFFILSSTNQDVFNSRLSGIGSDNGMKDRGIKHPSGKLPQKKPFYTIYNPNEDRTWNEPIIA